jgi:hypothetical protein
MCVRDRTAIPRIISPTKKRDESPSNKNDESKYNRERAHPREIRLYLERRNLSCNRLVLGHRRFNINRLNKRKVGAGDRHGELHVSHKEFLSPF